MRSWPLLQWVCAALIAALAAAPELAEFRAFSVEWYTRTKDNLAMFIEMATDRVTYAAAVADPVGLVEIAKRLGVERGTAKQWNLRKLLPPPRWTVSGAPAWEWKDIEKWARKTGRLSEGD